MINGTNSFQYNFLVNPIFQINRLWETNREIPIVDLEMMLSFLQCKDGILQCSESARQNL